MFLIFDSIHEQTQVSVYFIISENSSITADAVLFISTVEFVICTVHLTMCHAVTRVVFQSGHFIAWWVTNKGKRDPKFTLVGPLSRVTNMAPKGSRRVRSRRQTVSWSLWRLIRFSRLVLLCWKLHLLWKSLDDFAKMLSIVYCKHSESLALKFDFGVKRDTGNTKRIWSVTRSSLLGLVEGMNWMRCVSLV